MGKFDLGDYIGDRIRGEHTPVDTDAVWTKLNLDKKKKRKFIPFWWLSFGLLIIASSFLFYSLVVKDISLEQETTINSNIVDSLQKEITKLSSETSTKQVPKKQIPDEKTPSKSQEVQGKVDLINPSKKSNIPTSESQINSIQKKKKLAKSLFPLDINSANTNPLIEQSPIKTTKGLTNNSTSKAKQLAPLSEHQSSFEFIKLPSLENLLIYERGIIHAPKFMNPSNDKKTTIQKSSNLALIFRSGIYQVNKQLESPLMFSDHVQSRRNSEQSLEMITLTSAIRYTQPSGLFLEAGLEFATINERFDYQLIKRDTITEEQPLSLLVSSQQDTSVLESGMGYTESVIQSKWQHYNKVQLYTLPISLGYSIEAKRWAVEFQGTALLSYRRFSGIQIDLDGQPSSSPQYHMNNFKAGYRVAVGISYLLTQEFALQIQPTYQSHLTSFSDSYSQKYEMYGLQLGLKYKLHK